MAERRRYDPRSIEAKWQAYWLQNKTFKAENRSTKPKYYVLDMFPYPSGSGLHVGHVEGYTATDIVARYKRLRGFNVLHPMGWDSFGLPAEQYAIRTGTHPADTTKLNIDTFRRQLQSLGYSYDWDREFATSDPSYYKWTQWIFTKLYERGLAYEAEINVNFCPALGTVLANEEVENGRSKEGGFPVEKRPLRQWVLKITAYADRLLKDLDLLDWPEGLKKLQTNWIGRSEGAIIDFQEAQTGETFSVFTTRPDTLFGVTFYILSPEHPAIARITTPAQRKAVEAYQKLAAAESEQERTDLTKTKTGVFTGAYAINPVNGTKAPIWIADYVLLGYGTGAVMGVPGHDARDFEFAQTYQLPVIPVMDPQVDAHPELIPPNMDPQEVRKQVLAGRFCWGADDRYINSNNDNLSLNGLTFEEAMPRVLDWLEERKVGQRKVVYKLRDWLFSRQRYWGEPFPLLHLADGSKRLLDLDELPLTLPEIKDFKPSEDGQSPLAKATSWVNVTDPRTGAQARRETNTMPNWAGSCWYYLRFCDPLNTQEAWSPEAQSYWLPVDLYVGGVEHAVLHLLYARFWHKVLYDCGFVSTPEPFQCLRNQGLIVGRSFQRSNGLYVAPEDVVERAGSYFHRQTNEPLRSQIEKMSKSKLNGVNPDEIIQEFGADSLRLYEMFLGPLEKEKPWNTDAVSGCRRFLNRFFDLVSSEKVCDQESEEALRLGHRVVHAVGKDIESLQFNTAIAKLMEFLNDFTVLPAYPRSVLKMVTQILSPFAPHIAEEAWELLGGQGELSYMPWPTVEPRYLIDEKVTVVVQINGKVRDRLEVPRNESEASVLATAQKSPVVSRYLDDHAIQKVVFVPNRLLNIVIAGTDGTK